MQQTVKHQLEILPELRLWKPIQIVKRRAELGG